MEAMTLAGLEHWQLPLRLCNCADHIVSAIPTGVSPCWLGLCTHHGKQVVTCHAGSSFRLGLRWRPVTSSRLRWRWSQCNRSRSAFSFRDLPLDLDLLPLPFLPLEASYSSVSHVDSCQSTSSCWHVESSHSAFLALGLTGCVH